MHSHKPRFTSIFAEHKAIFLNSKGVGSTRIHDAMMVISGGVISFYERRRKSVREDAAQNAVLKSSAIWSGAKWRPPGRTPASALLCSRKIIWPFPVLCWSRGGLFPELRTWWGPFPPLPAGKITQGFWNLSSLINLYHSLPKQWKHSPIHNNTN